MDEDINLFKEHISGVKKNPEFDFKTRSKVADTPLKEPMVNTQLIYKNPVVIIERMTSNSYRNMSINVSPAESTNHKSNDKIMEIDDSETKSSQAEEASPVQPKKKRRKAKFSVRKRTLNRRNSSFQPQESRNLRLTINKSTSDVDLEKEMNRIHGLLQKPDEAVSPEQKRQSLKKAVDVKTSKSRNKSLSNWKDDLLNDQTDWSEEDRKATLRPKDFLDESDSSQDQEPAKITSNTKTKGSFIVQNNEKSFRSSEAESSEEKESVVTPTVIKKLNKELKDQDAGMNFRKVKVSKEGVKKPTKKVVNIKSKTERPSRLCKKPISSIDVTAGSDKQQSIVVEPPLSDIKIKKKKSFNRELEGLKIKFDRELMSEFDEGIEMNESNDLGIYKTVYRIANCERNLRVRRSYPLSEMHLKQEPQLKKIKKEAEFSTSIAEEAVSYANLMRRFEEFGKNGISNTSEALTSTSTRVHSNFVGKLLLKLFGITFY
ncbi:unnamed protein product [Diamesa hyperborea]